MSNEAEFAAGDTARLDGVTDVTVKYGPYQQYTNTGDTYLVALNNGGHKPVSATRLSRPAPGFAVGDVVSQQGSPEAAEFVLEMGPYSSRSLLWWVARRLSNGEMSPLFELNIKLVRRAEPPAPTVGDRVRVVNAPWADQYNGRVGVISKVSSDPILTFGVKFADGDEVWATTVEPASDSDSAPEVGDQVRVTVTGRSTSEFLGKVGKLTQIDHDDDNLPYRVEFPGDDTWSWVRGVEHA